jgi:NAD(P)H-hydrate epimerase
VRQLLKDPKAKNIVIDADALNICAENKWLSLPSSWIATPHEGELARLLEVSARSIRKDRISAAGKAQKKLGCVVLLKGHKTLVATSRKIYEIQSGNAALAKAGTGDVLTGMITGFLAQGLSSVEAACLGAFVHGLIADRWVQAGNDPLSLLTSDLLAALPQTLSWIRKS